MVHEVNLPREVYVEEYYVLRGISDSGVCKKVIKEKEFQSKPTIEQIALFLEESKADFVSVETNYRFDKLEGLPFA